MEKLGCHVAAVDVVAAVLHMPIAEQPLEGQDVLTVLAAAAEDTDSDRHCFSARKVLCHPDPLVAASACLFVGFAEARALAGGGGQKERCSWPEVVKARCEVMEDHCCVVTFAAREREAVVAVLVLAALVAGLIAQQCSRRL